jgi:hypothetical protein
MKKAITNVFCDGVLYEKGKVFNEGDVAHLDQNDFETVGETSPKKEEAKTLTNADLKPVKKGKK